MSFPCFWNFFPQHAAAFTEIEQRLPSGIGCRDFPCWGWQHPGLAGAGSRWAMPAPAWLHRQQQRVALAVSLLLWLVLQTPLWEMGLSSSNCSVPKLRPASLVKELKKKLVCNSSVITEFFCWLSDCKDKPLLIAWLKHMWDIWTSHFCNFKTDAL